MGTRATATRSQRDVRSMNQVEQTDNDKNEASERPTVDPFQCLVLISQMGVHTSNLESDCPGELVTQTGFGIAYVGGDRGYRVGEFLPGDVVAHWNEAVPSPLDVSTVPFGAFPDPYRFHGSKPRTVRASPLPPVGAGTTLICWISSLVLANLFHRDLRHITPRELRRVVPFTPLKNGTVRRVGQRDERAELVGNRERGL